MIELIVLGILCHFIGDYLFQSHWMATEKTNHWLPAIAHGVTYTIPFMFLTQSIPALLVICVTHILIDHYRLARHVGWFKNQFGPKRTRPSFSEAMANGGYSASTPAWLSVWLMIITDNTLHVLINTAALIWL